MEVINTFQVEKYAARVQVRVVRSKRERRRLRENLEVRSKGGKGSPGTEDGGLGESLREPE